MESRLPPLGHFIGATLDTRQCVNFGIGGWAELQLHVAGCHHLDGLDVLKSIGSPRHVALGVEHRLLASARILGHSGPHTLARVGGVRACKFTSRHFQRFQKSTTRNLKCFDILYEGGGGPPRELTMHTTTRPTHGSWSLALRYARALLLSVAACQGSDRSQYVLTRHPTTRLP